MGGTVHKLLFEEVAECVTQPRFHENLNYNKHIFLLESEKIVLKSYVLNKARLQMIMLRTCKTSFFLPLGVEPHRGSIYLLLEGHCWYLMGRKELEGTGRR